MEREVAPDNGINLTALCAAHYPERSPTSSRSMAGQPETAVMA